MRNLPEQKLRNLSRKTHIRRDRSAAQEHGGICLVRARGCGRDAASAC
jgi:hypothetical protein